MRVRVVTFGQIEGGVIPVGKKGLMLIGLFYLSANFSFELAYLPEVAEFRESLHTKIQTGWDKFHISFLQGIVYY